MSEAARDASPGLVRVERSQGAAAKKWRKRLRWCLPGERARRRTGSRSAIFSVTFRARPAISFACSGPRFWPGVDPVDGSHSGTSTVVPAHRIPFEEAGCRQRWTRAVSGAGPAKRR